MTAPADRITHTALNRDFAARPLTLCSVAEVLQKVRPCERTFLKEARFIARGQSYKIVGKLDDIMIFLSNVCKGAARMWSLNDPYRSCNRSTTRPFEKPIQFHTTGKGMKLMSMK
jgi:hypothetical protein